MSFLKDLADVEYGKGLPEKTRKPGTTKVYGSAGEVGAHNQPLYNEPIIVVGRKGNISGVHKVDGPSWVIDTAYAIKAKPELDRDYLFYFLKYNTAHLAQADQSTAVPSLAREVLYSLELNPPKIEIQRQTVKKIENLFKEIESGAEEFQKANKKIDLYKQSVLNFAIQGKLMPQDPKDEPASKLLERIREEKEQLIKDKKLKKEKPLSPINSTVVPFELPLGWEWTRLNTIFKFIDYRGKNPNKSESGYRLITAKNVRNGYIKNEPVEYISEETYRKWMVRGFPKKGDLLFITEGHTMGFVAEVDLEFEFALAQRTIDLQPFNSEYSHLYYYFLQSQYFQNKVKNLATGSAAQGIKAALLKDVLIPMPSKLAVVNSVSYFDKAFSEVSVLKKAIDKSLLDLSILKQSILKSAFEGKLI